MYYEIIQAISSAKGALLRQCGVPKSETTGSVSRPGFVREKRQEKRKENYKRKGIRRPHFESQEAVVQFSFLSELDCRMPYRPLGKNWRE